METSHIENKIPDRKKRPAPKRANWIWTPLRKAIVATSFSIVFLLAGLYGFLAAPTAGSPYWREAASRLPPLFSRAHEPAYREHSFRPIGPREQLFHNDTITHWAAADSPVKDLTHNRLVNIWQVERKNSAPILLQQLYLSHGREALGALDVVGNVKMYQGEIWVDLNTRAPSGTFLGVADDVKDLSANDSLVFAVAFSPDGKRVVTAHNDATARIWDATAGVLLQTLSGHEDFVGHVSFSPDGRRIATASNDNSARIWDANTGALVTVFNGHDGWVLRSEFSPDGSRVITSSEDNTTQIWDPASGEIVQTLESGKLANNRAIFSRDGSRIVTWSRDGNGSIWDAATGRRIHILPTGTSRIKRAAFSPDGAQVMATTEDGTVMIWEADTGTLNIDGLTGQDSPTSHAAYSPDGEHIVTVSGDDTAQIWDVKTRSVVATLSGHEGPVAYAEFSPDGSRIVTGSADTTARIWNAASGELSATLEGHDGMVFYATFSADGSRVVTASDDNTARVWSLLFSNQDQILKPTALDPAAALIFGETRLQHGTRPNEISFFPSPVRAVFEKTDRTRLAVGDRGAIYCGAPLSNIQACQTENTSPPLGTIAGLQWFTIEAPRGDANSPALQAVHFSGETGIAVGQQGLIMVSFNGGRIWHSGTLGGDPRPNLKDIRVDTANNYAVTIGLPETNTPVIIDLYNSIAQFFGFSPIIQIRHNHLYKTLIFPSAEANNVGTWAHVPAEAGAPLVSYGLFFLAFLSLLISIYYLHVWWIATDTKEEPVAAGKSDREIGWEDNDALGLQQMALQISRFLRNVKTEPPLVLGVAGGWGSGKSSLMNLLLQNLQRRGASAIWFNAWHHQKEDHLLAALFEAVRIRAIPNFWTIEGVRFRTRLVAPRLARHAMRVLPAATIIALTVVLASLAMTDEHARFLSKYGEKFWGSLFANGTLNATGYVVTAFPALGLLYWLRSLWVALPTQPAKMLKDFASLTRIGDFRDKLSFRHNFGKAFGEVCTALRRPGVPGLVIFIDDLDRCQAKSILSIFEAVNYFISVGDCIVVMGFDRTQVEHAIGLELKNIAATIPDDELPIAYAGKQLDKPRAYARLYMEKVINLEITIPELTPEGAANLAQARSEPSVFDEPRDKRWVTRIRPRLRAVLRFGLKAGRVALLVVIAALFWKQGMHLYERVADVAPKTIDSPAPAPETTENTDSNSDNKSDENRDPERSPSAQFQEGKQERTALAPPEAAPTPITARWNWEELWFLLPTLFVTGLAVLWFFLRRTHLALYESEYDPDTFVKALKEANQIVESVNGTPRAIKRYMNRMRFVSARMRTINYEAGLLDLFAEHLGIVSKKFASQAISNPKIHDSQVIALGAAEVVLRRLPDSNDDNITLDGLMDNHIDNLKGNIEAVEVSKKIKDLLRKARVNTEELQIYTQTVQSENAPIINITGEQRDKS